MTSFSYSKENLSDYYSSYIYIKNCNELDSFMYVDNESFKEAKNSIKKIENLVNKNSANYSTK